MKVLRIISILCLLLIAGVSARAAFDIQPGEELVYDVSYMGISLGNIVISTDKLKSENGVSYYDTKAEIRTHKAIKFMKIKVDYHSRLDKKLTHSHRFHGEYQSGDYWDLHKIFFNYDKSSIWVSKENKDGKYFEKSYSNKKLFSDGLSIFFVARNFLMSNKKVTVPTIVDKKLESTELNFTGKQVDIRTDKIKYPVNTLYFNGKAHWTGVYGLSGGFEGWFSNDDARVPIVAKLNLYLGVAKVELIKWNRKGWEPPKGK